MVLLLCQLDVGFGAIGMFHRPFVGLRCPLMIILLCLKILRFCFVKMAMQLSSQSCPIDISEPDLMPLKIWAFFASVDKFGLKGMMADWCGVMMVPFATCTRGPDDVGRTFMQYGAAAGSR